MPRSDALVCAGSDGQRDSSRSNSWRTSISRRRCSSLCGLPSIDTTDGHDITPLLKGEDKPLREVAVTENVWSKALALGSLAICPLSQGPFRLRRGRIVQSGERSQRDHQPLSRSRFAGNRFPVPQAASGVADHDHSVCDGAYPRPPGCRRAAAPSLRPTTKKATRWASRSASGAIASTIYRARILMRAPKASGLLCPRAAENFIIP